MVDRADAARTSVTTDASDAFVQIRCLAPVDTRAALLQAGCRAPVGARGGFVQARRLAPIDAHNERTGLERAKKLHQVLAVETLSRTRSPGMNPVPSHPS